MAIHDLYATPNREQPGFRIGSPSAPVIPVEWECRFTSRLTFYSAAGGEPLRQNALLRVIRLGTGEIYIPTDRATGAILFPPRPNATGDPEPALFQIELLRLRPARGGQPDDGGEGPCALSGFVSGTLIATPTGQVKVESLRAGDLVETIDHGPRALSWVGRRDLRDEDLRAAPQLRPIRIVAGALGRDVPAADLHVSPQMRLRLRSKIARNLFDSLQVLVPAKQLCQVDGIDIRKQALPVSYVYLMFDQHELVTANGAVTESFLPGRRAMRLIDPAMKQELIASCPDLRDDNPGFAPARPMLSGHQSRKLVVRHIDKGRPLIS